MTDLPAPVGPGAQPPAKKPEPPKPPAVGQEIERILENLPQEQRRVLEQSFSMMIQGPMMNPLLGKIDGEHIHKIIDVSEAEAKRDWEDRGQGRKHLQQIAIIGLVGFLAISALFLLLNAGELLKGVLIGFAIFAGGLGAGSRFLKEEDD